MTLPSHTVVVEVLTIEGWRSDRGSLEGIFMGFLHLRSRDSWDQFDFCARAGDGMLAPGFVATVPVYGLSDPMGMMTGRIRDDR